MTLIEELRWRGMVQDIMPGTEEQLNKEMTNHLKRFEKVDEALVIAVKHINEQLITQSKSLTENISKMDNELSKAVNWFSECIENLTISIDENKSKK
jgi:hypothetical protein